MIASTRIVLSLLAPAGLLAGAGAATVIAAPSVAAASTPSATTLVDGVLKNMSTLPAIEATGTASGLKVQGVVLPKKQEASETLSLTGNGVSLELQFLTIGKVDFMKSNLVGLEFFASGSASTAKLAPYVDKWVIAPKGVSAITPTDFGPTISGLGTLLCNPTSSSVSSTATVNGSTSTASTGGCSLSGTTVTSYSATKAVIHSKGLGNATITFTAVGGKLLPTKAVYSGSSSTATSGGTSASASSGKSTESFSYPSSAPSLSAPTGATKLPANL